MLIGGFLYHRSDRDGSMFWKKRLTSLVIPWIICAITTYLINAVLCKRFVFEDFFCWVLGSGSWYYYIVIYFILLFLFKWISQSNILLVGSILINIVSLILESENLLPSIPYITAYLNIFNWIGIFAIGVICRKQLPLVRKIVKYLVFLSIPIAVVAICVVRYTGADSYFFPESLVLELSVAVFVFAIAWCLTTMRINDFLVGIGKNTYFIYLVHMQPVQILGIKLPKYIIFDIARPFIGLLLMMGLIYCLNKSGRRIKWCEKILPYVGFKLIPEHRSIAS